MDRIGVIGGTGLISIDIEGQHQDFLLSKNMSVVRIDDINAETEFGIVPLRCITIDYEGKPKELITTDGASKCFAGQDLVTNERKVKTLQRVSAYFL